MAGKHLICSGCGYPYKLGEPYMGEMCDTGGQCNGK